MTFYVAILSPTEILVTKRMIEAIKSLNDKIVYNYETPMPDIRRITNCIYNYELYGYKLYTYNWSIDNELVGKVFRYEDVNQELRGSFRDSYGDILYIYTISDYFIDGKIQQAKKDFEILYENQTKAKIFDFSYIPMIDNFTSYARTNGIRMSKNVYCWKKNHLIILIHDKSYIGISIPQYYSVERFVRDIESQIKKYELFIQPIKEIVNVMLSIDELNEYASFLMMYGIV